MFEARSSWPIWIRVLGLAALLVLPSCGGCSDDENKVEVAEDPCKPPAVDPTGPIRFHEAVRFIYANSACPRQTGVDEAKLDPLRVSVVRGSVRDHEGNPLANARVSFPGHPEFGESHTFGDGSYDFVTHGGGEVVVRFTAEGRLSSQRSVAVARNQFSVLHDVVLLAESEKATPIQFGDQWQLASGETSPADDSAPRTVHVLFPPQVHATVVKADGTSEPLSGGTFRVTEYTRGALGDEAMPGTLPATSAYTYASNFGFDETREAKSVTFDVPVIAYLDNFLHMKAGAAVPAGVFSPDDNAWGGEESGRVVTMTTGGLDANGDGQPDGEPELQALGVRPGELETAKAALEEGRSYLRVPLRHFSPWDFNWGFGPPAGSSYPPGGNDPNSENDPCTTEGGSYFECESQTLFESIPIVGTDDSLSYASDRVPGRKNASTFSIPITDETVPGPVKRAELEIVVLGKRITKTFPGPIAPHTSERFTWDGADAYGRPWPGQTFATVRIGFVYDGAYMDTESFAAWGASVGNGGAVTGDAMRREIVLWRSYDVRIGTWSALGQSFGGWSLSAHHSYDAATRTLFYGDGRKRSTDGMGAAVDVVAGLPSDGGDTSSGDGGPAVAARLAGPWASAVAPDGSVYIGELDGYRIRKVGRDGTITTIAGTGKDGSSGDGGPAAAAEIHAPRALAVRRDGAVCFTSFDTVRCVGQDGIIRTVAGGGDKEVSAAGVPAREASLLWLAGLAFGPDGAMYFGGLTYVYKLDPNGKTLRHVAGGGDDEGNDVPALRASLFEPLGIAVDKDGAVYVAAGQGNRVRRIDPSGIVSTIAGTGEKGTSGDGGSALTAKLNNPYALAVDGDGTLYIGDFSSVRRVRKGRISMFAGGGDQEKVAPGILARRLDSVWITALTVGPDGAVYAADYLRRQIFRLRRPMPEASPNETVIAEQDGSELYVFDARGRHLRTLDPLTRAVRRTFAYDSAGRLAHVDDAHGNVTTIQRDERGLATAIVAPFGARTSLEYEGGAASGDGAALAAIVDPIGRRDHFAYEAGLLLTKRIDPGGGVHAMQYDADGLLARDANAENASWSLTRESESPRRVRVTTGMNRSRVHEQVSLVDEDEHRTYTAEDGAKRTWTRRQDGTEETVWPDGTTTTARFDPDPRFGMEAPYVSRSVMTLPSGLSRTIDTAWNARFAPDGALLGLEAKRTTQDGESTASFDAGTRTWTHSTAAGRRMRSVLDASGRLVRSEVPGIDPVDFVYDDRGRVAERKQGDRRLTYGYGADGEVQSVHDALGPVASFERDAALRTTAAIRPDGARTTFAYDALDGIVGLSPPGKSAHAMTYAKDGRELSYQAPAAPLLAIAYDGDRAWASRTHEDGSRTTLERDAAGRPATLRFEGGFVTTSYATSGQVARLTGPGAATLDFVYDGALSKSVAVGGATRGSIAWTYDPLFRAATESISGNDAVEYGYDADGLLVSAARVMLGRDAATGRITSRTAAGVTETFAYTPHGEIANQQSSTGAGALLEIAYEYDLRGRVVAKTENGVAWRYEYDPANRLSRVLKNGAEVDAFTFDANGNRTDHGAAVDGQDRLTRHGDATYTYTARGERATKVTPAGTTTYGYDGRGNLVSVSLPSGARIEYGVDALGRRITRSRNGTVTHRWIYRSQLQPAAEVDAQGNVLTQFIYARGRNVPDAMIRGNTTYAIVTDHLGSVRYVVDNADDVVQTADYDVWGRVVTASGAGFQPFGFAGGMFDPETGLVHLGAREYDPDTGTWTRKDPSRFRGGWNLYGYCYGDPINYIDVTGNHPLVIAIIAIDVAEAALIAAVVTAGATAAYLAINRLWDEAKGGRDREGDDTRGRTADEIRERFAGSKSAQEIKDMIKRAEKFRGERNKQKRKSNRQTPGGGPPGGPCPDDANDDSSDEAAE